MISYYDAMLLDQLKQEFCHLNLDRCGAIQKTVTVKKSSKKHVKYTVQVNIKSKKNDEVNILHLFHSFLLYLGRRRGDDCSFGYVQSNFIRYHR